MKYKVIAEYRETGHKVNYTYEGDGEYMGKQETVLERIYRHFIKDNIKSFDIIPII